MLGAFFGFSRFLVSYWTLAGKLGFLQSGVKFGPYTFSGRRN